VLAQRIEQRGSWIEIERIALPIDRERDVFGLYGQGLRSGIRCCGWGRQRQGGDAGRLETSRRDAAE
jgi:hypothetical protein